MAVRGDYKNLQRRVGSPKRVKADAYGYVSEGRYSREIEKLARIERFGMKAITGMEIFYYHDFICLTTAESVVVAYRSRQRENDWVDWAKNNPYPASLLKEIEILLDAD